MKLTKLKLMIIMASEAIQGVTIIYCGKTSCKKTCPTSRSNPTIGLIKKFIQVFHSILRKRTFWTTQCDVQYANILYLPFPCFYHLFLLILKSLVTAAFHPSHLSEFLTFLRKESWGYDLKTSCRSKTKEETEPKGKRESLIGKCCQGRAVVFEHENATIFSEHILQQETVFHGADSK